MPNQAPEPVRQVSGVFISRLPVVLHTASPSFFKPHSTPLYMPSATPFIPPFSYRAVGTSCRLNFPMQRYSGRPVIKYRRANRLMDLHGSLPKSKMSFQSPFRRCRRVGYSMKSLTVYLPFRPFPAVWPACKINPDREAERASRRGKEKSSTN